MFHFLKLFIFTIFDVISNITIFDVLFTYIWIIRIKTMYALAIFPPYLYSF